MWSRLCSPGSWSLPVLAVCAACCCKALLPLWNLSVDREHLGPGRASSLLGPHMYTQGGSEWRRGGGRGGLGVREVQQSVHLTDSVVSLCILSNFCTRCPARPYMCTLYISICTACVCCSVPPLTGSVKMQRVL